MQKNVLITGAAKRIGASCARLLHAQGYNVFLHYQTSVMQATELRDELNAIRPHSAAIHAADLLQMPELVNLAKQAQLEWGGIDVLINNASSFYPNDVQKTTQTQWDELLGYDVFIQLYINTVVINLFGFNNTIDVTRQLF